MYLEMRNYSKTVDGNKLLDGINFRLDSGKIYGLQGKNGSGKTMLLKAMCGLIFPTEGEVEINGEVLGKDREFPESVGALIEQPGMFGGYSGFRNLKNLAAIRGRISEEEIVDWMGKMGLDASDKKKVKKYSLGMKQKLGIIAAMMESPDMILLDEPTNALDIESVEKLNRLLLCQKERNALIVIASHDMEELRLLCDDIFFVDRGRIVEKRTTEGDGQYGKDREEK